MIESDGKLPWLIENLFVKGSLLTFSLWRNVGLHLLIAVITFSLAISNLSLTSNVVQISFADYGNMTALNFSLDKPMKGQVFVIYQLENFHQNTYTYMNSLSRDQLRGSFVQQKALETSCGKMYLYNKQLGVNKSWSGIPLDPEAIASPCGEIAYTYFNDSYKLENSKGQKIKISNKDISWPGLKNNVYKRSKNSEKTQWIDPQNQRFINWMQISSIGVFRKVWGKIQGGLNPGDYSIKVQNNYPVLYYGAGKSLILSTETAFGGRDWFQGYFQLSLGILELLIVAIILVKKYCLNIENP